MFIEFVRRLANRTNDIRIKPKLIVSFILVVFVPVLIVGVFLTLAFRQNVLDQATQQVGSNVDRVKSQIANIVRMPLEVSDNLLSDARLMNVVNTQYASTYSVVEAYREYRDIRDSVKLYNEIHNIRFYYTNPTMLDNWEFLRITPEKTREPWFHQAMTEDGIRWQYVEDETKGNQKYLSLVRKVNFPLYRTSGVLVITIDPEVLGSMMRQEAFDTMIIEDNGYIVAAKDGALVGKNINDATFNSPIAGKSEGTYEFRYDGKPSRVVIEKLIPTSSRNGLRVVRVRRGQHCRRSEPDQLAWAGHHACQSRCCMGAYLFDLNVNLQANAAPSQGSQQGGDGRLKRHLLRQRQRRDRHVVPSI